jgi:hypothetical protein
MHALASRGSKFLQRIETDRVRDNQNSDCKATFRVGADKKRRRTSHSWPLRRGLPPAIEDTNGLLPDKRQNEKPMSEIVDHFVTESGNA